MRQGWPPGPGDTEKPNSTNRPSPLPTTAAVREGTATVPGAKPPPGCAGAGSHLPGPGPSRLHNATRGEEGGEASLPHPSPTGR